MREETPKGPMSGPISGPPPFDTDVADDGLSIPPTNADLTVVSGPERILPSLAVDAAPPMPAVAAPMPIPPLRPTSSGKADARCIVLMGAHGGAGTSTLAIQMAYELAVQSKAKGMGSPRTPSKVCLIDLDFEAGSCATYLDLPPSLNMDDLSGGAERIDPSLTQALMSTHNSGVALLGTGYCLGGNDQVNTQTVLALLDAASQIYDHIIIDMPRLWRPWTQAAIAAADHFALVSELTIPALHMARQRSQSIEEALTLDAPCEVILNRVERRSFRNSLRVADAKKVLRRDVSGTICVDLDTTREAINCGEPVGAVRAEARYAKDTRAVLSGWNLIEAASAKPRKDRRRLRA